jgi:hypothetical protein
MIKFLDEEARMEPSGEKMGDVWWPESLLRVISYTPVIAFKIRTLPKTSLLAIVLPFGENTQDRGSGTGIVRTDASHEDPTPPPMCTSVANSDSCCFRSWEFVGRDGKAE